MEEGRTEGERKVEYLEEEHTEVIHNVAMIRMRPKEPGHLTLYTFDRSKGLESVDMEGVSDLDCSYFALKRVTYDGDAIDILMRWPVVCGLAKWRTSTNELITRLDCWWDEKRAREEEA